MHVFDQRTTLMSANDHYTVHGNYAIAHSQTGRRTSTVFQYYCDENTTALIDADTGTNAPPVRWVQPEKDGWKVS